MWPGWGPWYGKGHLPTNADSVFGTISCGAEACFSGQQRERRVGFYSERNVLCGNYNVTIFVVVFNVCLV